MESIVLCPEGSIGKSYYAIPIWYPMFFDGYRSSTGTLSHQCSENGDASRLRERMNDNAEVVHDGAPSQATITLCL
jgi:hypothetical protein